MSRGACAHPVERTRHSHGKHPHVPDNSAPDIDAEAILELMVHYGSLEFAFQFEQGVATATYDSFHDAFADVPASASRGSSQRSFHTCWPGSPDPRWWRFRRCGPGARRRVNGTVNVTDQSDRSSAHIRQLTGTVSKQAISGIVESWTGRFSHRCLRKSGASWSLVLGGGPTIAMR